MSSPRSFRRAAFAPAVIAFAGAHAHAHGHQQYGHQHGHQHRDGWRDLRASHAGASYMSGRRGRRADGGEPEPPDDARQEHSRGHHGGHRGPRGFAPPWAAAGFGSGPFGGRARARRGDIRAAILRLLAEQPMHGYQVIRELAERSGGAWQPSPGSVYPTLQVLEDQGLVAASEVEGRKVFALTDDGRAEAARTSSAPPPWEAAADEHTGLAELRQVTVGVMDAARQVGGAGTPSQVTRAVALLKETRRRLYQLLAEEPDAEERPQ